MVKLEVAIKPIAYTPFRSAMPEDCGHHDIVVVTEDAAQAGEVEQFLRDVAAHRKDRGQNTEAFVISENGKQAKPFKFLAKSP